MAWEVIPVGSNVHVVPQNDTHPHFTPENKLPPVCPCEPIEEIKNGKVIYVHNSFDGREGLEWANEILK